MRFTKTQLATAEHGYVVTTSRILGKQRIVAAAEGYGPVLTFDLPSLQAKVVATEPGGCMGIVPYPKRDDALLAITGFYPPFKSEGAGIHLYRSDRGLWVGRRLFDLPFVHRICTVSNGDRDYLVAATVCGGKTSTDDWSQPGAVYVSEVPADFGGEWALVPVLEGIHRNHGMYASKDRDPECVYISGDEGVFILRPPGLRESEWHLSHPMSRPVSELHPVDIDDDGEIELAVIEPFHGSRMTIYKERETEWVSVFSSALAFGHGLWAGTLLGLPVVIAANRAGSHDLVCFRVANHEPLVLESYVIDAGSGTTSVDVMEYRDRPILVASNARHAEYALYEVHED